MMPPSPGACENKHVAETVDKVVRHEIALYNRVHGVHPAAKHSWRRDVDGAGPQPEPCDSSDNGGLSDRESRRDSYRNGRDSRRRRGSPDGSESSDQAVTSPPSHRDRHTLSSHHRYRSPNDPGGQSGEETRGWKASRRDNGTTSFVKVPKGRLFQVMKTPVSSNSASSGTAPSTHFTAPSSTIAHTAYDKCLQASRGPSVRRTNVR